MNLSSQQLRVKGSPSHVERGGAKIRDDLPRLVPNYERIGSVLLRSMSGTLHVADARHDIVVNEELARVFNLLVLKLT